MKKIILNIALICTACILLTSCGSALISMLNRTRQPTEETRANQSEEPAAIPTDAAGQDVQTPSPTTPGRDAQSAPTNEPEREILPLPSPIPKPEPSPEPDPEAEAEARRLAFSKQWKRTVFDKVRSYHESLLADLPEKHELHGWWEYLQYTYSVVLYDAGFDAPNLIITDHMHDFMMELGTLYVIKGGTLEEIITAQWIEPLVNRVTGARDLISATWHGGGTASETHFYRYAGGRWQWESYIYLTGGGQYFIDEATGEYGEWDEAERLLDERLKDYDYMPFETAHIIEFDYATIDGRPIPWSQVARDLSAYLDDYDGIYVNLQ